MLNLTIKNYEVYVKGDTYQHKDLLKHMGFRWAPEQKVWHRCCTETRTLSYIQGLLALNAVPFTADSSCVCDHVMLEEELRAYRTQLNETLRVIQRL